MKRHLYVKLASIVCAVAATALVASCDSFFGKANQGKEKETVENTETKNAPDPNAPDERYLTQDLRMWWLFGPVRSFQTTISRVDGPSRWDEYALEYFGEERLYDNLSISIQFDAQGHFSNTIDGNYTTEEIDKTDGDRILVVKRYIGEMNNNIIKQWKYYPNGLVKQCVLDGSENAEEYYYYYNEVGELSRMEAKGWSGPDGWKIASVFSIQECDKFGNWVKQIAEVTHYEYDYNTEDYKQKGVGHEMYYRIIDYYGQESSSQYVVIDATELRLRLGPSTSAGILRWEDGSERYPNKGERYLFLGESGDFYKIDYKGRELWVSKKYTYLE